jgi:hypothetical protein
MAALRGGFLFSYICFMISVIDVYRTLVDYCNKDQKGFVTPRVFNSFASLAQSKIYNSFFSSVATAKGLRINQTDGSKEFSSNKYIKEDLSRYIKKVRLQKADVGQYGYRDEDGGTSLIDSPPYLSSGIFKKPNDLARVISVSTGRKVLCELVYNDDDINHILKSNLSRPSPFFPVALIGRDIEVFPQDNSGTNGLDLMTLSYYRQPRSLHVVGQGTIQSGEVDEQSDPFYAEASENIADPINCRDFDLPEHYKSELVEIIASYIGIRLRDPLLTAKPQQ